MADVDTGYRSIELVIINDTKTDLSIQAANIVSGDWIDTEKANSGTIIPQYSKIKLGCKTDDLNSSAEFSFELIGDGSPLVIDAFNTAGGNSNVVFSTNAGCMIKGSSIEAETNEENHSVFIAQITPCVPKNLVP